MIKHDLKRKPRPLNYIKDFWWADRKEYSFSLKLKLTWDILDRHLKHYLWCKPFGHKLKSHETGESDAYTAGTSTHCDRCLVIIEITRRWKKDLNYVQDD